MESTRLRDTKFTKSTKSHLLKRLAIFVAFVGFVLLGRIEADQAPPKRIISLVPALTEILFAIGAGPQVIAVSNFDEDPPD